MMEWIRKSFRNRIFASVMLITLLPILLSNVLFLSYQVGRTDRDQKRAAEAVLAASRERLSGLTGRMEQAAKKLSGSTVVHSALRRGSGDSRILYQVLFRETEELRSLVRVDICLPDGALCDSTGTTDPGDFLPYWGVLHRASQSGALTYHIGAGENGAFRAARAVRSFDGGILGYIVFTVGHDSLDDLFSGVLGGTEDLLLLNRQWELAYGSRPAAAESCAGDLRTRLLSGEDMGVDSAGKCRYDFLEDHTTGMTLVLRQNLVFSAPVLRTFYLTSLLLGLLSLGLCLLCARWLSGNLSQPIHRLSRAMGRVMEGDLTVQLQTRRVDELGRLAHSFNRMTREYRANLERSVEHQRELNETRIRMMQAQLNPHFLYNTLDSMKWLGVTHRVPQIAELATDLAALLRFSISQAEFVTVEQELEFIDRYLEIQYIRFEDRFACEVDVEERFQHCELPKLILQPLVENAIIHGVADQNEGYIKITAWEEAGDLVLCVQDNGCGIPAETLEKLKSGGEPGKHLGLYNVNQILGLHYGERYGVRAESAPGRGSRVMVRLPLRIREEEIPC